MADETPIDVTKASDECLIGLIAARCEQAIAELYRRWFPQFNKLATKLTSSPQVGEDLAQDAIVRIIDKASLYKSDQPAKKWLVAILMNLVRDRARREKLRRAASLSAPPEEDDGPRAIEIPARDPSPHERAMAREQAAVIRAALEKLTPAEREVILLRDYMGLDAPETAHRLGISTGTVGGRLHRARKRLGGLLPPDVLGAFQSHEL
jgi:RNA polymerase sigma-70 factor (ECF subfamily)